MKAPPPSWIAWHEIAPYLDRALELDGADRDTWVAELATTHPEIAEAIHKMLARHAVLDAAGFLAQSPSPVDFNRVRAGIKIGAYTLERLLGRGGMGEVWSATRNDGRFEGRCAIKFLRGCATQGELGKRFRIEGQLLAQLTHPNIARLLDAGATEDGVPYLAIEYVDGVRIDEYCDAHALSIDERVRLCSAVVAAAAHAHGRLIIHRDLKPSNVLVTADADVKLLDFGIAKLLNADLAIGVTRVEDAALTPEYAAPEQLLGEMPSTATDVYQLGLLLYVVLAGRLPMQSSGTRTERIRAALDGVIAPVSELASPVNAKRLRGDLDAILAKALRPNPVERYATAQALHDELNRYLNSEPVEARRGATWYGARKFVARHRVGVIASLFAAAALCSAAVFALVQMGVAREQRDQARLEAQRADAESKFLNLMMSQLGGPDDPITPAKVLEKGSDLLARDYQDDPEFAVEMLIRMSGRFMDMGDHRRELETLVRAEKIARQHSDWLSLARVQCNTVETEDILGNIAGAAARLADGQAALARAKGASIEDELTCIDASADLMNAQGRVRDSIAALERSVALREQHGLTSRIPFPPLLYRLSTMYGSLGEPNKAYELVHRARLIHEQMGRAGTLYWVGTLHGEARALMQLGEWQAALDAESKVVAAHLEQGTDAQLPAGLSGLYGSLLANMGRTAEALTWYERAQRDARQSGDIGGMLNTHLVRARTLISLQRWEEAGADLDAIGSLASDHAMQFEAQRGRALLLRAELLQRRGDIDESKRTLGSVLDQVRNPDNPLAFYLDDALLIAARNAIAEGKLVEAEQQTNQALQVNLSRARGPETSADVGEALLQLADVKLRLDERAAATDLTKRAARTLQNSVGANHPLTQAARTRLTQSVG